MMKLCLRLGLLFMLVINDGVCAPNVLHEAIQVPKCLAQQLNQSYPVLAENDAFQILNVPLKDLKSLRLLADKTACGGFVNVSTHLKSSAHDIMQAKAQALLNQSPPQYAFKNRAYPIQHRADVQMAIEHIQPDRIWQTLSQMTTFVNRSATQKTGVDTAHWLKKQFESLIDDANQKHVDAYFVDTQAPYVQPSLVTVIGKDIKAPAVVLGAHMDTLGDTPYERMPGAGDDGSGSASAMEVARVLLQSNVANHLKRPVYIIWYAAEEQGLVGSQRVVEAFLKDQIPVAAVMQLDMTGYRNLEHDKTMWIYEDYTDKALNQFIEQLIKTYIDVPIGYSKCGYGCSDHASWMMQGIPAVFPCETNFKDHNPYIHTGADTLNLLSLEHMTNFTKLGLAFVLELALV